MGYIRHGGYTCAWGLNQQWFIAMRWQQLGRLVDGDGKLTKGAEIIREKGKLAMILTYAVLLKFNQTYMEKNKDVLSITCLCLAILLCSCTAPVTSGLSETDKQFIQNSMTNAQDNWNKGNKDPYVNRFSSDAFYMAPNMETMTGKDAIRNFANSFPEVRIKFDIVELSGSTDLAYMRGAYTITTPKDSLFDKGKFMGIWRKTAENNWQLTHDMFSSDLPLTR
jgi:ketosteroid isomerase-like protein